MIAASDNWIKAAGALGAQPVFVLSIDSYSRTFISVLSEETGEYAWIETENHLGDFDITAQELEGSSTLADMTATVLDGSIVAGRLITADYPNFQFKGKTATLQAGFVGLDRSDFITLATLVVDSMDLAADNCAYQFTLKDFSRFLQQNIYLYGDDGHGISSDHTLYRRGNPLDLVADILQNQLQTPIPINTDALDAIKNNLLAGVEVEFTLDSSPEAKSFIEQELLKPFGLYYFENNLGQFTVASIIPIAAPVPVFGFDETNVIGLPGSTPSQTTMGLGSVINAIKFDYDSDGNDFKSELLWVEEDSITRYGQSSYYQIQSKGARSEFGYSGFAALLAHNLTMRYGYPDDYRPYAIDAKWAACRLEPGDFVTLSHSKIPNLAAGTMGVSDLLLQVLEPTRKHTDGETSFQLLDVSWLKGLGGAAGAYQVAANGTPAWTAATAAQKAAAMFLAGAATHKYSDGTAGHPTL